MNSYAVVCYVCGHTLFYIDQPIFAVEPRTLSWCENCCSNRVLPQCLVRSNPFGAGCTNLDITVTAC